MDIKFHKTVLKARKKNHGMQVVQTVRTADPASDPEKTAKAREFLNSRGIQMVKGVYGAPVSS